MALGTKLRRSARATIRLTRRRASGKSLLRPRGPRFDCACARCRVPDIRSAPSRFWRRGFQYRPSASLTLTCLVRRCPRQCTSLTGFLISRPWRRSTRHLFRNLRRTKRTANTSGYFASRKAPSIRQDSPRTASINSRRWKQIHQVQRQVSRPSETPSSM